MAIFFKIIFATADYCLVCTVRFILSHGVVCSAHVALIPRCILRLGVQMKVSLVFALHLFANYKGQLSF